MKTLRRALTVAVAATVLAVTFGKAAAAEVTGTLGSPSATTTMDGEQLPAPDPKFGGVIKENAVQAKPWWAPRIVPPKGAPNVLLIMTDDSGYGVPSTFGGVIPTPALDRIANILQWDESFDIGSDTLTGVNDADYQPPFTLTAKLDKLAIKVDRPKLTPEDEKKLMEAERNNRASE